MPRRKTDVKVRGVYEKVPGSGVWWICYFSGGIKRREKIGTKSDAVTTYQDRKSSIRRGEKMPTNFRTKSVTLSVLGQDAIDWYLKHNKKDIYTFTGRMKTIMNGPLGKRPAASISHNDIEQWIEEQATAKVKRKVRRKGKDEFVEVTNNWSPATKNRYKTTFSRAYSLAIKKGKVDSNPATLVTKQQEDNVRARYLTKSEEKRLLDVVRTRAPKHLPLILFALHTGARKSEQLRLTWDKVDFDLKMITLVNTKRRGLTRYVAMNATVIVALSSIKRSQTHNFVFPSLYGDKPLRDPDTFFESVLEEAKIHDCTWHTLRHTFISNLVMKGVPLAIVGKIVGHSNEKMTERYTHLFDDTALAAVAKLDEVTSPVSGPEAAAVASL